LYDNMILNGTGLGQPSGILLNPGADNSQPAVVNSGDANTLTADGLISLGFTLPEQYEDGAAFVMNKTSTAATVAKLKDQDNRYLWGYGLQDSGLQVNMRGRTLLGYDVVLSGFMPNVGTSNYPIIFGDLNGYYLVNRVGFSIQVLRELYAETNQVLILGRLRFGGQVTEPWKLRIHRCHS
jgi:HK97 family phage major capsid protein